MAVDTKRPGLEVVKWETHPTYTRTEATAADGVDLEIGTVLAETGGKVDAYDPTAANGLETVTGVLLTDLPPGKTERAVMMLSDGPALVGDTLLVFRDAITQEQKDAAIQALAAKGIKTTTILKGGLNG